MGESDRIGERCPCRPVIRTLDQIDDGPRCPFPPDAPRQIIAPVTAATNGSGGSRAEEASGGAQIRTFLIADVRGYTLFTQERGDEAAGKLAAKFADIAREGVEARGGTLLELRGDEALCVFSSARDAIRAAIDLQQRFVDETIDHYSDHTADLEAILDAAATAAPG